MKKDKKDKKKAKLVDISIQTERPNILLLNYKGCYESIKLNYIFWISSIICICIITHYSTQKNYIHNVITYLIAMIVGWYVHVISHNSSVLELYDKCDCRFILYIKKFCPKIDKFIRNIILYTWDFHHIIHHDSSVNKSIFNLIHEFMQNFLMEGGFLLFLSSVENQAWNLMQ